VFDFRPSRPLRIASLVKQIPKFEEMELSPDGRLVRGGVELHMNDYCRRAVRTGCELALASEGACTAITLGPPEADSVLREAILCGCARGLHVNDPAFAGSDTLATATTLAAALDRHGPWDLVLCGRHSIDADTGQVPAQLAELLSLPLLTGVRELTVDGEEVAALLEHNDEWIRARVDLPADSMPDLVVGSLIGFLTGARSRLDPAPYNRNDGFSPTVQILMNFPGGVDLVRSDVARLDPATGNFDMRSLERDHPTVLLDAETGERILHFVENDDRASGERVWMADIGQSEVHVLEAI
jgi:hypothetical protein